MVLRAAAQYDNPLPLKPPPERPRRWLRYSSKTFRRASLMLAAHIVIQKHGMVGTGGRAARLELRTDH
jgi:hypothetical protein